jgi:D-3-phosphoglycerate dehydrogenase
MLRILNIEPDNYNQEARSILNSFATVREEKVSKRKLLELLPDFDVLIVRLAHNIDREVINSGKDLKAIVTATTGLDHIDTEVTEKRGIVVLSLKDETDFLQSITATAELTWGLLLSLIRRVPYAFNDVLHNNWRRDNFIGRELKGKILGIIGYGRLGRIVASYAKAFRMSVFAYTHNRKDCENYGVEWKDLEELLSVSDVISIHIPLTGETINFLDSVKLALLKPGSILINTSRGELIDEAALIDCLKNGKIAGAALDVLSGEKHYRSGDGSWPECDPLVEYAKIHSNLLLTPHIGGASTDSMHATEIFMAEKLRRYLKDRSLI